MSTCATCRHWTPPTERSDYGNAVSFANDEWDDDADGGFGGYRRGAEEDRRFGSCRAVVEGWDLSDEPTPLAVVRDGSDYKAELYTRDEFGCVLHEPTPLTATSDPAGTSEQEASS